MDKAEEIIAAPIVLKTLYKLLIEKNIITKEEFSSKLYELMEKDKIEQRKMFKDIKRFNRSIRGSMYS